MVKPALNHKQIVQSKRQLVTLSGLLTLQFILGAALSTLIDYSPAKHSTVQAVFLILHIIVALGLLAVAGLRLVYCLKWRSQVSYASGILLCIIGAMIAGAIAAKTGNGVSVFMMAMFFLAAFGAIGYSMSALRDSVG